MQKFTRSTTDSKRPKALTRKMENRNFRPEDPDHVNKNTTLSVSPVASPLAPQRQQKWEKQGLRGYVMCR